MASPSFTGMVFPCPGAMFWAAVSAFRCVFCNRAGNVVSSSFGKFHFFVASPSFTGMVFPCPGAMF